MPAPDLIAAGEVDRFAADFRTCRDRGLARNCEQYARDRMVARHPTESRRSIDSVVQHGRNAVDFGNRANQSADRTVLGTFPGQDPADTQYGGGQRGTIRYRYGTTVTVTVTSGPNAGSQFPIRVYVNSRTPMSAGDVRSQAVEEGQRIADSYMKDSDRLANSDLQITADVRIESAYRDRA